MNRTAHALPPICPGCGRFLRSTAEQARGRCDRCPPPAATPNLPRACCQSEPACDDCPLQGVWSANDE